MKLIVLAFFAAVIPSLVHAQTMTIQMKDGGKVQYRVSDIEKITYSENDALKGVWSGNYSAYNDPSGSHGEGITLRIDFDAMNAWSSHCNYEKSIGKVKILPHSKIQIDWPGCGVEKVDFSLCGESITATGAEKAFSNGRMITTGWRLNKD